MTTNRRALLYPLLLLAGAGLLWWIPSHEEPRPAPPPPTWPSTPPSPREGGPPGLAPAPPPPAVEAGAEPAAPRLLPGSALLDPQTWPHQSPGIPDREAARSLARIRWQPPRTPLPGEQEVPDPDRIGPCPPRSLPSGHADSPVVRRYIDPGSLEPTWVHRDGSITALHVYVEEGPDGTRRPGVLRRTGVPKEK